MLLVAGERRDGTVESSGSLKGLFLLSFLSKDVDLYIIFSSYYDLV
jgi:hypothetical protein